MSDAGTLGWDPSVAPWAAALLALLAVAAIAAGLRGTRDWPLRRRAALLALRASVAVPLALALAGLSRVEQTSLDVRRSALWLVDGSASMAVRHGTGTRTDQLRAELAARADELARLDERAVVQALWAGDAIEPFDLDPVAPWPDADGARTDYRARLDDALAAAETRPAAVFLAGDGADQGVLGRAFARGGADALAPLLADVDVPVHVMPLGGAVEGDWTVRIGRLAPFAFVRRPIPVPVQVDADGQAGEVTVSLRRDGELVASRTVTLAGGDEPTLLELEVVPPEPGYLSLRVEIPVPAGDPMPGSNADERTLRVIRDRVRVLQLAGHPSWDVRYLRRLLKTDPNLDLVSFFILRDAPLLGRHRRTPLSLIEFPHEELFLEDLRGFDLVVLQDFALDALLPLSAVREEYAAALDGYVRDGGALLVVGGDHPLGAAGDPGGQLAGLLPLLPTDGAVVAGGPVEPTDAGRRHPVSALAGDALERWPRQIPPDRVDPNRLAADALLLARSGSESGPPLLAVREVGRGRVASLATDGSWRWALDEGGVHGRFWRDCIRWLVRDDRDDRLELRAVGENVEPGATVELRGWLRDPTHEPIAAGRLSVAVEPLQGGAEAPIVRDGVSAEDGSWTVVLDPLPPATYEARLSAPDDPGAGEARARFTVRPDRAELRDADARPELLYAIAEASGGAVIGPDRALDDLPLALPAGAGSIRRFARPAWDRAWWLLVATCPLAIEWTLRRRWGG